jgi:outer membrane cobalamin receptor
MMKQAGCKQPYGNKCGRIFTMLLLNICLCIMPLAGQTLVVEGKVRDINTHREIAGVNVSIPEIQIGTVTDASGNFKLEIVRPEPDMVVEFQHIGYDTLSLTVEDVLSRKIIELQERLIPVMPVTFYSQRSDENKLWEFHRDLPQPTAILDTRVMDLHGYVDAGDLLQSEQSIQIDEDLSGKKTVSIRGGNPDEVIVMYNGIRMNNAFDNIFDISLIDLTELERLEVIKGSNTAIYGSEAFSGVVNIVPRSRQDYKIRFQQRFGSYNSGDWGLYLHQNFGKLHGSYSFKQGKTQRVFESNLAGSNPLLENTVSHQTAQLKYHLKEDAAGNVLSALGVLYIRSRLRFDNQRDSENLENFSQMISMRFDGDIGQLKNLSLSGAYQWLDEDQFLLFSDKRDAGFLTRNLENRSWHFNVDKTQQIANLSLLIGYQFKKSSLDFRDDRFLINQTYSDLSNNLFQRLQHGVVLISKYRYPINWRYFPFVSFDASLRYDYVNDREANENSPTGSTDITSWGKTTVKVSIHTRGSNGKFSLKSFVNFGSNVKFPTLLQQISAREALASGGNATSLSPEKNQSVEAGVEFAREVRQDQLFGWDLGANVFHNRYQNKFRSYYLPGTPIAFFDNVDEATISGIEVKQRTYLFNKKTTLEIGYSRYFLSDAATFPFKSDRKYTFDIRIDEGGYALRINAYKEGKQIGQIRKTDGSFSEIEIGSVGNINIFFSKTFQLKRVDWFLNASFRNILNDDYQLEGLTLRDRRYYFTFGIQY